MQDHPKCIHITQKLIGSFDNSGTSQRTLLHPTSESAPSDILHSDACNSEISSSYLMEVSDTAPSHVFIRNLNCSSFKQTSLGMTEADYTRQQNMNMITEILDRVRRLEAQNRINYEPPPCY